MLADVLGSITVQCNAVIKWGQFSHKHSQKTPYSSPIRARYGCLFVDLASDWYSASVPVVIYVISYNIGLRYNSTWLYWLEFEYFVLISLAINDLGQSSEDQMMSVKKANMILQYLAALQVQRDNTMCPGPLLLTWINSSFDKLSHPLWSVELNYLSVCKLQQNTIQVWGWILISSHTLLGM